ncbi:Eco57I restriction-modification methylase domain-containing protein [Marinagarivorans algicola]|uniref:Eco57I restriction-modification methylase domain-containing protein n=1 Tax=Marinagarivorans algicola TaxID=1513270 RepID=UPI0037367117
MAFFQASVLNKYLAAQDQEMINEAYSKYVKYFHNKDIQKNIRAAKEEQFQEGFLRELFVKILGYTLNPEPYYNLTTELKNQKDAKKCDGAILKDGSALAVIELKGTDTTDLGKINDQAFNYKNNQAGCVYVITSNFEKLRFYIHNAVEYIEFNIFSLNKCEFKLLYLCLSRDNLINAIPEKVKRDSIVSEKTITKKLYKDYSDFKSQLWEEIKNISTINDHLFLYKKTQKLLDRFLFILFSEDSGLLPPNTITLEVQRWKKLEELDAYKPLYEIFKQYFNYINKGKKSNSGTDQIFAYNGGLFKPDETLDSLKISDYVLETNILKLTKYDFNSEIDVNILGHIFENSLNDIDAVKTKLAGKEIDIGITKRKKDGVFYTPKFITKYIIDNSLGKLCEDKKSELVIDEKDFHKKMKGRHTKTLKNLKEKLNLYRSWLLELTICDPACGSGAFLNQALEFLIEEHKYIDELESKLFDYGFVFQYVADHILENNLYGVDINEESVEIAKLSLWLRTAQKGRKLTTLSNNIKCGNTLISDKKVDQKYAFDWLEGFPVVMSKGGFDVIIGNPPYGILIDKDHEDFYEANFPNASYKKNLYILFLERMTQLFSRGLVHFIIPKSLLFNTYFESIRNHLIKNTKINEIYAITEEVFEGADVGSSVLIQFEVRSSGNSDNHVNLISVEKSRDFVEESNQIKNKLSQSYFLNVPNTEISIFAKEMKTVLEKLNSLFCIKDRYALRNGLNPGNIKHILISERKETDKYKPITWGKEISKYYTNYGGSYVNYDEGIRDKVSLDDIKTKKGMKKQAKIDFALRSKDIFENKKLLVRKTGDSLISDLDVSNLYFDTLVHGIYQLTNDYPLEALLPIINSPVSTYFYRCLHDIKGKAFAKISLDNLGAFPIPELNEKMVSELVDATHSLKDYKKKLELTKAHFLELIISEYGIEKISNKMATWYSLDWQEFVKEITKKHKLNLEEKSDLLKFFDNKKNECTLFANQLSSSLDKVDHLVLDIYGLTETEKNFVQSQI